MTTITRDYNNYGTKDSFVSDWASVVAVFDGELLDPADVMTVSQKNGYIDTVDGKRMHGKAVILSANFERCGACIMKLKNIATDGDVAWHYSRALGKPLKHTQEVLDLIATSREVRYRNWMQSR